MALHVAQPAGQNHTILNWDVANAAARNALVVVTGDIGKVCRQADTLEYWILASEIGPIWKPLSVPAGTLPAGNYVYNLLINSSFRVNQKNVSGSVVLAAGVYGHDGFKAGASGCTYTFSTSGGVTTITITAGSLIQVVEGAFLVSGAVTLSWTGTAQGKIGTGSYSVSPQVGAAVAGTNLNVEFGTGTIQGPVLVPGSSAATYTNEEPVQELRRCQRYCVRLAVDASVTTTFFGSASVFTPGNAAFFHYNLPVRMRAIPVLVMEGAFGNYALFSNATGGYSALSGIPSVNAVTSTEFVLLSMGIATSLTPGQIAYFCHTVNNTESIRFEARL